MLLWDWFLLKSWMNKELLQSSAEPSCLNSRAMVAIPKELSCFNLLRHFLKVLTVSPATEATLTILPPFPPFDFPILSIAVYTPRDAPSNMTSKFFSHPCYKKWQKFKFSFWIQMLHIHFRFKDDTSTPHDLFIMMLTAIVNHQFNFMGKKR